MACLDPVGNRVDVRVSVFCRWSQLERTRIGPVLYPVERFALTSFLVVGYRDLVRDLLLPRTKRIFPCQVDVPTAFYRPWSFQRRGVFRTVGAASDFNRWLPLCARGVFLTCLYRDDLPLFHVVRVGKVTYRVRARQAVGTREGRERESELVRVASPVRSALIQVAVMDRVRVRVTRITGSSQMAIVNYLVGRFVETQCDVPTVRANDLTPRLLVDLFNVPRDGFLPAARFRSILLRRVYRLHGRVLQRVVDFHRTFFLRRLLTFQETRPRTTERFIAARVRYKR